MIGCRAMYAESSELPASAHCADIRIYVHALRATTNPALGANRAVRDLNRCLAGLASGFAWPATKPPLQPFGFRPAAGHENGPDARHEPTRTRGGVGILGTFRVPRSGFRVPRRRFSCPDMAAGRKAGRGEAPREEALASRPGGASTRTNRGTRLPPWREFVVARQRPHRI